MSGSGAANLKLALDILESAQRTVLAYIGQLYAVEKRARKLGSSVWSWVPNAEKVLRKARCAVLTIRRAQSSCHRREFLMKLGIFEQIEQKTGIRNVSYRKFLILTPHHSSRQQPGSEAVVTRLV